MRPRYVKSEVLAGLGRRMILLSGARQVGKTTLARSLPGAVAGYLNWDARDDRERILAQELPASDLWVFDEIHKYRHWRNYLKGLYDTRSTGQRILVTGSGRLDLYRHSGDSLQGRYRLFRLHPFSVAELGLRTPADVRALLELGGFPEPWLSGSVNEARLWSRHYRSLLIEEEAASLEAIRDLGQLQLMMLTLADRVGSPLSIQALSGQLRISHGTTSAWLAAAERLYAIFRIPPFGASLVRATTRQRKHYHFDWTVVRDEGPRFENLVACHLLKWVHWRQDTHGSDLELRFFRDRDGREVDFVVADRDEARLLVECKRGDRPVDRGLRYLKAKFPAAAAWQISSAGTRDYQTPDGIRVAPALPFLGSLV